MALFEVVVRSSNGRLIERHIRRYSSFSVALSVTKYVLWKKGARSVNVTVKHYYEKHHERTTKKGGKPSQGSLF